MAESIEPIKTIIDFIHRQGEPVRDFSPEEVIERHFTKMRYQLRQKFLEAYTPRREDAQAARLFVDSLTGRIEDYCRNNPNENPLGIRQIVHVGSMADETGTDKISDFDYFLCINPGEDYALSDPEAPYNRVLPRVYVPTDDSPRSDWLQFTEPVPLEECRDPKKGINHVVQAVSVYEAASKLLETAVDEFWSQDELARTKTFKWCEDTTWDLHSPKRKILEVSDRDSDQLLLRIVFFTCLEILHDEEMKSMAYALACGDNKWQKTFGKEEVRFITRRSNRRDPDTEHLDVDGEFDEYQVPRSNRRDPDTEHPDPDEYHVPRFMELAWAFRTETYKMIKLYLKLKFPELAKNGRSQMIAKAFMGRFMFSEKEWSSALMGHTILRFLDYFSRCITRGKMEHCYFLQYGGAHAACDSILDGIDGLDEIQKAIDEDAHDGRKFLQVF